MKRYLLVLSAIVVLAALVGCQQATPCPACPATPTPTKMPTPAPDPITLTLHKQVPEYPDIDKEFTEKIEVTANEDLYSISVQVNLPAGLHLVHATPTQYGSVKDTPLEWRFDKMKRGETKPIDMTLIAYAFVEGTETVKAVGYRQTAEVNAKTDKIVLVGVYPNCNVDVVGTLAVGETFYLVVTVSTYPLERPDRFAEGTLELPNNAKYIRTVPPSDAPPLAKKALGTVTEYLGDPKEDPLMAGGLRWSEMEFQGARAAVLEMQATTSGQVYTKVTFTDKYRFPQGCSAARTPWIAPR